MKTTEEKNQKLLEAIKLFHSVLSDWNKDGQYANLIYYAEQVIEKTK